MSRIKRNNTRARAPKGLPGVVVAHFGVAVDVDVGGTVASVRLSRNSGIVVGDDVLVDGDSIELLPRRTELKRRSPSGGIHVVAANIDVLGIVAAVDPPARAGLVDRAAVAARAAGITPLLILNKSDLPGAANVLQEQQARVCGDFEVCAVSAVSGDGIDRLMAHFASRGRVALIGPSGVGKSSLTNRLVPDSTQRVRALSEATGAGVHTTTGAMLFRLPGGGELVDTPGIREYGLVDVSRTELAAYFPGFAAVENACRFRDCIHAEEPGCAVRAAVESGTVPGTRYAAYRTLLSELA